MHKHSSKKEPADIDVIVMQIVETVTQPAEDEKRSKKEEEISTQLKYPFPLLL